ncbi:hypothetical protein E2C01_040990 [Portunus trituberculatus]|uniref:Uncharacterized protein n=1 Tax=Portunus trituberculatus TaxID=210409 RepID=A0A5B7FPQ9_PORTR|nr:hypothetical protein [Portunus trituberculatus]
MPRRDAERSSQKEAGNFRQNVGSERPVDTPLRTEIRGSSAKEFQKASRFLRRRRSVSKLAWETKAKMKAKRQNLAVALSQRCGRTSAGLLRSCGEPEMNCQPGEGDSRQAEMVEGKCNHLSLAGNQSAPAERESPPREDRSSKRYLQQIEDTALVMVTDGGGEDGGGYQRRRRELGNLSQTPNVTYRCSPYHKYWLFASSMPMGLYPLRVKILQSGNLTRIVPTSQESRPHEITTESPTTTQRPPTTPTPHHRADIPPEEEDYIDKDEEEDPSQYPENPSTPSSIPPTHPTTSVHSTLPSTTQQPLSSSRPPYTTVRVTNKWVEETLAKVKTVVDSILKSIGSARSNVEENSSSKKTPDQDGVNESKEGSEKRMERRKDIKGERENGRKRGEEGEKEKERNSDRQGQARDDRERGTRKEGIEMGRLGKKRSRERNRKGKSEGNKRRTERRESQITLESSEDQEADGREGERNGRGENTESLRNEHNNRERRKLGRRRNAPRNKTENNRSFPDSGNEGSESEFSNNTVSQESDRIPGTWKQKAGGAALSPPNRVSELSGADESVSSSEENGEKDAAARNTEFGIETETLPVPLSVVSQGGGVTRSESDRHLIKKSEGTNYPPDTNVRTESPATSSPRDNRNRDEHVVSLEASTSLPTKISSSIDSGNNGNDTTGDSGAPASKQTISSVTDLLFTVPNERVIKPAQNSQVQSEIKSTEKLIRTSLEGLLFRVPPGGTTSTISSSKQSQEEKSSLIASENSQTATTTTAVPDATTPMREVTRLDSTEAPSVDAETIVAGSKPAHRQRSEERRRKKISGAEGTQNPVYQRLNATENESRQPDRVEEKEQEEEEEGELILRTACLPVGSIGRFKVEGVTYLVTGMGAGPGAEDCWREVTNVVNRHIRLPALNQTTLLATTAFYFVAASANLIEPEMTYGFVRVEQFRLAANYFHYHRHSHHCHHFHHHDCS